MSQPWYDYRVSQGYGQNGEQGVDLATPFHTPITNVYQGTVVEANYGAAGGIVGILVNVPGLGQVVEYFLHLDLINVVKGQLVQVGQQVGLSGGENPGYPGGLHPASKRFSTGPHTEFGFFSGTPFASQNKGDPYPYLVGATQQTGGGTNARFAVASTTSDSGSSWWQVFLSGLGIGMNNAGVNGSSDPNAGTIWQVFLRGLGIGFANTSTSGGNSSYWTQYIKEAGFFILALVLVVLGIVLVAHDPDEQGPQHSIPAAFLKAVPK